jgi:hypothetical protein
MVGGIAGAANANRVYRMGQVNRARPVVIAVIVMAAALLAGCSQGPARPAPSASVSPAHSARPARTARPAVASRRPGKKWTSLSLVITQHSLGGVAIGMTMQQASAAAGEPLIPVGDGAYSPRGGAGASLSVQDTQGAVACVNAVVSGTSLRVTTAQGFPLGGTLSQLKAVYGTSLQFVPPPTTGYSTSPGYVVNLPGGNLAFIISRGKVESIAGGPGVVPTTPC